MHKVPGRTRYNKCVGGVGGGGYAESSRGTLNIKGMTEGPCWVPPDSSDVYLQHPAAQRRSCLRVNTECRERLSPPSEALPWALVHLSPIGPRHI